MGSMLTIENIRKAGYTYVRTESAVFDYAGITARGRFKAERSNPVRFLLVSATAANQIASFDGPLGGIVAVPADGTPVRCSLRTGKAAPDGELQITFRRDPTTLSHRGEPCTWSAAIEVIGGGIVEAGGNSNGQMAPAEGYAQSVEYPQTEQKRGVGARSFYIKTADGKYGRIDLELYARDEGSAGRCLIRGAINTSGSRLVVNLAATARPK